MNRSCIDPIFIVGVGRSGTTLLVNLMGNHPLLAPIYETHFLRKVLRHCEKACWFWGDSISRRLSSLLGDSHVHRYFMKRCDKVKRRIASTIESLPDGSIKQKYEKFPFGQAHYILFNVEELEQETDRWLQNLLASPLPEKAVYQSAREFIDRIFSIHCARMNKPYWINKTPNLLSYLDRLPKLYPSAKYIHIVRDGRDVAASFLSLSWGPRTTRDAARHWKKRLLEGHRRVNPTKLKYLELRYEDLIDSPREMLKKVFSFVEMEADVDEILSRMPIYQTRVGSWKSVLTHEDRKIFRTEAGDLLIELGYEKDDRWVDHSPPS